LKADVERREKKIKDLEVDLKKEKALTKQKEQTV
jgi:hypothetical protein